MKINMVGPFVVNSPFGTEIAFRKGLEAIGHEITTIDPNLPNQKFTEDADATIVFKTAKDYNEALWEIGGVKIVYQPDDFRFPHIQEMMKEMSEYCDFALAFDRASAKGIENLGYTLSKELVLTADPDLYRHIDTPKDIDLCFVGSLSGSPSHKSRVRMIQTLQEAGLKVVYAHDLYNIEQIVQVYNRSKIILNHATDVGQPFGQGYGLQCRHFEAGFTKSCLLSNTVIGDNRLVNFARYDSEETLVSTAKALLTSNIARQTMADNFYRELNARHRPEHRALEIIDFIKECQNAS